MPPSFDPGKFWSKFRDGDSYLTPPTRVGKRGVLKTSLDFYARLAFGPARWLYRKAVKGQCDDTAWAYSSAWLATILENAGASLEITGMSVLREPDPCVFIANHMSTLETFLLPGIIRPKKPVTFVVKESLVKIPFFGPIMRSRDPVVVGRVNPREDLQAVLEGGKARLDQGISIVVFPQSTRSQKFCREQFNSIGIKLAKHACVKAVPLALKTDAWGQGRRIKELGKIRPDLPVHFKFGSPLGIIGNGKIQHQEICDFIESNLLRWQIEGGINS